MDPQTFSRRTREHLDRAEDTLHALIDCLRRERTALTELDGPGAARIAQEKEAIVRRESDLATERRTLVSDAAALLRERTGGAVDLSLGEIVERLRPPGGNAILVQRARVRALAAEAQRLNALNRQLCAHALACVRGYLALAGHTSHETYGPRGRVSTVNAAAATYARRM
jgi:flagellar biosynthesis/type III secretory pathway chaperone